MTRPIIIIGGGLAGLTLGIGLRRKHVPVTIWEAGHYPRHRVCGEFISGRGVDVLGRMDLKQLVVEAGAVEAHHTVFFKEKDRGPIREIQPAALCVSRFILDSRLAEHFVGLGGVLRQEKRWTQPYSEGIVRANGRRLCAPQKRGRWYGLKVHVTNVTLLADLEMHSLMNGYVGLCRLKENRINVCGLFRRNHAPENAASDSKSPVYTWKQQLCGPPGTSLHSRLASAVFDETSFCSVAGLDLSAHEASHQDECCIGDALTMTPPVTGNGMSMAVEAAELAVEPLTAYSNGRVSWLQTRSAVAIACDGAFARRLAFAKWLQRLLFASTIRARLGRALLNSHFFWRIMLANTR
jgi:2-polyprenyl-6-methoxyphenol hydroxylase-like FAD-dependent oxidoreductase